MLGKAFPYPQRVQVWCFARGSRRTEPGYGASRAYGTSSRPQLQCSGCCYPPRPGHRFSRSLGPLARVLALVAYASRAEPGSYRGRSRERPQVLDVQAKLCRGSRWALESRLMLSPLPVVVTAQKPRRFADLAGFRFWAITKDVPPSYPTAAAP